MDRKISKIMKNTMRCYTIAFKLGLCIAGIMMTALCFAQSNERALKESMQSITEVLSHSAGADLPALIQVPDNTSDSNIALNEPVIKEPDPLVQLWYAFEDNVLLLLILIGVTVMVTFLVHHMIETYVPELRQRYYLHKIVWYCCWTFIVLTLLFVFFRRVGSLSTFMGLFFAGIIIALRDVITSFAGWFFVIGIKGFKVGDRIKIDNSKGDVIDIGMLRTSLMEVNENEENEQATGRIITLPNSFLLTNPLINYTEGNEFIWNEISVLITFESDWRVAEEAIMLIANREAETTVPLAKSSLKKISMKYLIKQGKLTPIVYVAIVDSGVRLTLRYLTKARQRRMTADRISRQIVDAFDRLPAVNFAYHTVRSIAEVNLNTTDTKIALDNLPATNPTEKKE